MYHLNEGSVVVGGADLSLNPKPREDLIALGGDIINYPEAANCGGFWFVVYLESPVTSNNGLLSPK